MKTGLVLEGGGMRGIYTVGVLDALLDNDVHFDYCIGVSAGAGNAVSYLSGQRGRGLRVNTQYVKDKRYIGIDPILHKKSVFGLDFIYDTIPQELDPFDYAHIRFDLRRREWVEGDGAAFVKQRLARTVRDVNACVNMVRAPGEQAQHPCGIRVVFGLA